MKRKIIKIDEDRCNGCGACAAACHEGAIEMINGVAKLTRENYCDGLGDCLPACPVNAIRFETREAPAYDEAAVLAEKQRKAALSCGCPGTQAKSLHPADIEEPVTTAHSQLKQWPVQIQLLPTVADFYDGANLLVAADCTAYAYGNFHNDFIRNHVAVIGCPKLDHVDYMEKLTAILASNDIKSVTVVRMEVPCCGGMEHAVKRALLIAGKCIPCRIITVSTDGRLLD